MLIYVSLCVILFGLMGLIWTKSDWFNLLLKVVFISMSIYGLALTWNDLVTLISQ